MAALHGVVFGVSRRFPEDGLDDSRMAGSGKPGAAAPGRYARSLSKALMPFTTTRDSPPGAPEGVPSVIAAAPASA